LDLWPEGRCQVLLPQADIADPRLARGLSARGASVQAVIAYHTVDYPADPDRSLAASLPAHAGQAPDAAAGPPAAVLTLAQAKTELGAGRLQAVVAASPSAARRIHADLAPLGGCRFVAIGRSTAAEARSLGLAVAAVAAEPTASGLVAAVVRALAPGDSPLRPAPHSSPAEHLPKDRP
jgi:uroporphyrinogen-III synthase